VDDHQHHRRQQHMRAQVRRAANDQHSAIADGVVPIWPGLQRRPGDDIHADAHGDHFVVLPCADG